MAETQPQEVIGLIAGDRSLPLMFARSAREAGVKRIVAVGFIGETNPALEGLVDELVWVKVGQLDKMIKALSKRGVRQCVMLGQVAPKHIYNILPDWRGLKLLMSIDHKHPHSVLGAVADEMAKDGVELVEATPWLKSCMPGPGLLLGKKPGEEDLSDVEFGFRMAKEISRLEIGQTVVVKNGIMVAVEAFEGTDRCIRRGGELAGKKGGAIAVKVAKQGHDLRWDIPCIGPKTIETCLESRISVIAVEAHRTLFLDREDWPPLTKRGKLTVMTWTG